tara:strand:+ start:1363 stop:1644 length:282 start_codon:yes stop_codon:yes gene_type:complete
MKPAWDDFLGQEQGRWIDIILGGESSWIYYSLCALFFTISGLACGYFIWRKGHMQMLDAELEVRRTDSELEALRKDLKLEEIEVQAVSEDQAP